MQTTLNLSALAKTFNRNIAIYPNYDISDYAERYVTTDDIYSIVRMLATTAALVPLRAYEIKDDKAAKKLKEISRPHSHPLHTKALILKALEELPEADALSELLENPSTGLSKFEFYEAVYTFLYLAGECFLYKERPEYGVNKGKTVSLLIMHPENVILKVTDTLPRRVVAYDYVVDGYKMMENIPVEDVIHIKYFNPELTYNGGELRGLSPIKVLAKRLVQLDSNLDVQTAQMQNGGVEVIVWDKGPETAYMDGKEISVVGQRKQQFMQHIKEPSNAGLPYFATGEMGVAQIGSNLADLKVIESAGVTFSKMCNVFGTSHLLFNVVEGTTFNNMDAVISRSYSNTTMPNVYRVRDGLKKGLLGDYKDKKREIREDISEITELQPNSKEMAEWLNTAWWVSPNEKREMMKFERLDNEMFDEPLIPSGLQTLSDMEMPEPLPDPLTPEGN